MDARLAKSLLYILSDFAKYTFSAFAIIKKSRKVFMVVSSELSKSICPTFPSITYTKEILATSERKELLSLVTNICFMF